MLFVCEREWNPRCIVWGKCDIMTHYSNISFNLFLVATLRNNNNRAETTLQQQSQIKSIRHMVMLVLALMSQCKRNNLHCVLSSLYNIVLEKICYTNIKPYLETNTNSHIMTKLAGTEGLLTLWLLYQDWKSDCWQHSVHADFHNS